MFKQSISAVLASVTILSLSGVIVPAATAADESSSEQIQGPRKPGTREASHGLRLIDTDVIHISAIHRKGVVAPDANNPSENGSTFTA